MTPEEMLEAASKIGEVEPNTEAGQVGASIVVTIWTVGSEIVRSIQGVEDAVRSLRRPDSDRSGDGWELESLTGRRSR